MSLITRPFTREFAWPAWKFGVLKVCMMVFGILVGSYFPQFWRDWEVALWIVFAVTAFLTAMWGIQAVAQPDHALQ